MSLLEKLSRQGGTEGNYREVGAMHLALSGWNKCVIIMNYNFNNDDEIFVWFSAVVAKFFA